MKPLHIGLLVGGAVIAAGLAVMMTQPAPIPVAPRVVQRVNPVVNPAVVSGPKPSPIPPAPASPRVSPAAPTRASAPAPVYDEPPKPAIRKYEPISTAGVRPSQAKPATAKPTQWTPAPYQGSAVPAKAQPAPAKPTPTPAPAPIEHAAAEPSPPPPPAARQVTLRAGVTISIRLDGSLSGDRNAAGSTFQASLAEPLVVDGFVIAEKGAQATGRVVASQQALIELGLATVMTSDGQRVAISSDPWTHRESGTIAGGTIVRFRVASGVTITERQIAGR